MLWQRARQTRLNRYCLAATGSHHWHLTPVTGITEGVLHCYAHATHRALWVGVGMFTCRSPRMWCVCAWHIAYTRYQAAAVFLMAYYRLQAVRGGASRKTSLDFLCRVIHDDSVMTDKTTGEQKIRAYPLPLQCTRTHCRARTCARVRVWT